MTEFNLPRNHLYCCARLASYVHIKCSYAGCAALRKAEERGAEVYVLRTSIAYCTDLRPPVQAFAAPSTNNPPPPLRFSPVWVLQEARTQDTGGEHDVDKRRIYSGTVSPFGSVFFCTDLACCGKKVAMSIYFLMSPPSEGLQIPREITFNHHKGKRTS